MYMFFIKIPHFLFRNIYNVRRENKQIKNKRRNNALRTMNECMRKTFTSATCLLSIKRTKMLDTILLLSLIHI